MRHAHALGLLATLAGCATPVAPTGGPVDSTAPRLVRSTPEAGATGVTDRVLTLEYSERLNPASASRAVTVSPVGSTPPVLSVRGRELRIEIAQLRDSTTYVVSVGAELADSRQVRIAGPTSFAFSTGDEIDRATLRGAVRHPVTGAGVPGMSVLAFSEGSYSDHADQAVQPDYQTETTADGSFQLDYMRPGAYLLRSIDDRNRNKRADEGERFALPRAATVLADTAATQRPGIEMFVNRRDTTAPTISRVRELSDRRIAVRFSEAVILHATWDPREPTAWIQISDSSSGDVVGGAAYLDPAFPSDLFVVANRPLAARPYVVKLTAADALADSTGNAVQPFSRSFRPPARADTVQARFLGFGPARREASVLPPGDYPSARFSSAPSDSTLASLSTRPAITGLALKTSDGTTVEFILESGEDPDSLGFEVAFTTRDTTVTQSLSFAKSEDLGGIVGTVPRDSAASIIVEARSPAGDAVYTAVADAGGRFSIPDLLPGNYRVRLFEDINGNGRWDGGSIQPLERPEPLLLLSDAVEVRARWETEIESADLALKLENL